MNKFLYFYNLKLNKRYLKHIIMAINQKVHYFHSSFMLSALLKFVIKNINFVNLSTINDSMDSSLEVKNIYKKTEETAMKFKKHFR